MPFGTISSQSVNYEPRDEGHYVKSSLEFGNPDDSFFVRGASTKNQDPLRASVSRVLQKDVVVAGSTQRKTCTVTLSIVTPSSGFTPTEIDSLATDLATFISPSSVSRLLMGES